MINNTDDLLHHLSVATYIAIWLCLHNYESRSILIMMKQKSLTHNYA